MAFDVMHDLDARVSHEESTEADPLDALPREPRSLIERTGLIGSSASMRSLREQIARFAASTASALVLGETGTGKELVARALHTLSRRARRPFVAVNVAALGETLLLSELFGHERGAFTGACGRHRGVFEQAHTGTLFLDEVGELSFEAQAALLRVLETREVRPVGAERTHAVDVRVIVATHRNLATMVSRGLFRADLYYRLATLILRVPALRHRVADLSQLSRALLTEVAREAGPRALDRTAIAALGEYGWPGNVRQLANVLRRAVASTDNATLLREDIRLALLDEPGAHDKIADGAAASTIASVLAAEHWNLTQAARRLGISRSTLRNRIRRAGLVRDG